MFKIPPKYEKPVSILIFIFSLVISFGVLFIPLDPQRLAAYGYISIFVITLLGALSIFIPGPTMVAAFVIGSVLNPFLVSLVAGLGSAIGETTGYTVGYASRALVAEREGSNAWYWRIFRWMTSRPFLTIFILSAIPNFLTDLSGLIAGRMEYSYPKFLLATFLGKSIRFGLSAYLGANLGSYFLRR